MNGKNTGDNSMSKSWRNGLSNTKLSNWWHSLASKDKMALTVLGLFLFAFGGIFGGMYLHKQASKQQVTFDKKVNELFWLRSQSGNLKPMDAQSSDKSNGSNSQITKIQRSLSQAGIVNPTVAQSGNDVQINFEHKSQSVVARVISQLQQEGMSFSRLQITQNESASNVRVQAIVN